MQHEPDKTNLKTYDNVLHSCRSLKGQDLKPQGEEFLVFSAKQKCFDLEMLRSKQLSFENTKAQTDHLQLCKTICN